MTDIKADREAGSFRNVLDPFEGIPERLDGYAIQRRSRVEPSPRHFEGDASAWASTSGFPPYHWDSSGRNGGHKRKGLAEEFFPITRLHDGDAFGSHFFVFVPEEYIHRKVDIKGDVLTTTEIHQAFDLGIVRIIVMPLAFKED